MCQVVLSWSQVTLYITHAWVPPEDWGHFTAVSWLFLWGQSQEEKIQCVYCYGCWISPGEYTVMAAMSARREVLCSYVVLCCICYYWCCASQRKINISAVSMAPQVFFQPLSSLLAYAGFSKHCRQCEQQDNWCHEQDKEQHSGLPFFFFFFNFWVFCNQGLNSCLLYLLHCHVLGHYHFLCISTKTLSNRPLYCILKVEFNLNVGRGLLVILGSCKEK